MQIDILKRMRRRSIGLQITQDGLVEVRAPHYIPQFIINRFVESKKDWIIQMKKKIASIPKVQKQIYSEGSSMHIAGKQYLIHHTDGNAIVIAGSRIFFPKKFYKKSKFHMEVWCRKYAKKFLTERLTKYAKIMGVTYKKITIRDTTSRWGSCSSTGTISFSYRLILAVLPIIDYVVIHELAHITHKHHQKNFWERVSQFYPEYKTARTWLTKNGHTLRV